MRKVKIIADSCADLNSKQLAEYGVDYVRMSVTYDEKEVPAELTWTPEQAHAFYDMLRAGTRIVTAQVSMVEFESVFEKYVKDGYDVVYIACSSKQSGSINTGKVMAGKLMETYPEAKISCIDSLNASIGIGMLVMEAARLAAEGKSVDEITDRIIAIRKTVNEFATVHSLDSLKRAGRVSASSAFFGNILGVKPILVADANGAQAAYKKVKGRRTSFKEIVSLLKESLVPEENATVYIAHADCEQKEIDMLTEFVKAELPEREVVVGYIGPIVGGSVGPDAIGVWAFGKEVTFKSEK